MEKAREQIALKKEKKEQKSKKKSSWKIVKTETITETNTLFPYTYKVYSDPPKELIPTAKDIGKIVECADYKMTNEPLKLSKIEKKTGYITVVSIRGFRTFRPESIILHRNEKKRNATDRVSSIYTNKVASKTRGKRR